MSSRGIHSRAATILTIGTVLCASPAIAAPGDTLIALGQGADGVTRVNAAGTNRTRLVQAVSSSLPRRIYAVGDACREVGLGMGDEEQVCSDSFIAAFDERLVPDPSFGTNGLLTIGTPVGVPVPRTTTALGIESRPLGCTVALFEQDQRGVRNLHLQKLAGGLNCPAPAWALNIADATRIQVQRGGALALDTDNSIILCSQSDAELWVSRRSSADGSPVMSFGSQGYGASGLDASCLDVLVDPQRRIVVAAHRLSDHNIVLLRFTSTGTLDGSFGIVETYLSALLGRDGLSKPGLIAAQPDSRYVLARENLVRRYNQDGTRDQSYGGGAGLVTVPIAPGFIYDVYVAPDATTVIAGVDEPVHPHTTFVASLNANGSYDETFGSGGIRTNLSSPTSGESISNVYSLALLPSGDLLVGGAGETDSPPPPDPDLVELALTAISFNPGAYIDSTSRLLEYPGRGELTFATGSGVIYRSPDGSRPSGGGDTYRVYGGRYRVAKMERCGTGIVTVFEGLPKGAYYSPRGHHLGGGDSTVYAYNGGSNILLMSPYNGGLLTAFSNRRIYRSNANCSLTGFAASATGNASNPNATPIAITSLDGTRVMTAYDDGRIYMSPDGTNLGGGAGSTALTHGPSSSTVYAMVPHSTEALTVFTDRRNIVYRSTGNGADVDGAIATTAASGWSLTTMLPYGTGVIASWDAGATKPIYKSTSSSNLAGGPTASQVYGGGARVVTMVRYGPSILTAFSNDGVYYSPNADNPASGRVYWYNDWPH
jgi:uncharacterized delta-60 repeat protein